MTIGLALNDVNYQSYVPGKSIINSRIDVQEAFPEKSAVCQRGVAGQ
jgi:hypothetical protein